MAVSNSHIQIQMYERHVFNPIYIQQKMERILLKNDTLHQLSNFTIFYDEIGSNFILSVSQFDLNE
jgi:hypothetical protein